MGPMALLARSVTLLYGALQTALVYAMIFAVLRLVLKRTWLTLLAGVLVLLLVNNGGNVVSGSWMDALSSALFVALMTFTVHRFGLLVVTVVLFVTNLLQVVPLTLNPSVWWATPSNLTLTLMIALACFGFYAARAGQPLFGRVLHE
jgi:hypothetical protein